MTYKTSQAPLLFCDVDGVLRARDQRYKTSGNAEDRHPDNHYDMDEDIIFDGNSWTFHYSSEMTGIVRDLIITDAVDFRWATNWMEYATARLNPLFQFPADLPHIPLTYVPGEDPMQAYKGEAVLHYLSELGNQVKPFVWVDDVATIQYQTGGEHEGAFDHFGVPYLIITPEERFGISREEMSLILNFLSSSSERTA